MNNIYKILLLFSLSFFLIYSATFSQAPPTDYPKIIPPSPNAASLGKFGDIPVSPYTGVPNISIPLYEVRSGNIVLPVSISYHASGIRVSEEASRVGLGWSLNAGGVIARTVIGQDDFIGGTYPYHNSHIADFPMGFQNGPTSYFQSHSLSFSSPYSISFEDLNSGLAEFEPDRYSYNFSGHSGKFVMKRNKEVVLGALEKIKFTCIGALGDSWEAITDDGTKYTFDKFETYKVEGPGGDITSKSAWYLTKVEAPTGETVSLNYYPANAFPEYIKPVGEYSERQYHTRLPAEDLCEVPMPQPVHGPVPGREYLNIILESIDFSQGKVQFLYGAREDVEGDVKLEKVQIFAREANGNISSSAFKEFEFAYDYFSSSFGANFNLDRAPYIYKRLKLLSVTEKGFKNGTSLIKNPYKFRYYEGNNFTNLPAKSSFARDHWGYYNGKIGNTSLIPSHSYINADNQIDFYIGLMGKQRDTDPKFITAFSLKEIEYPTKGRTEFEFEAHDFDPQLSISRDNSYFGLSRDFVIYKTTSKSTFYGGQNKGTVYVDTLDLRDMYVTRNGSYGFTSLNAGFRTNTTCNAVNTSSNVYFELSNANGAVIGTVTLGLPACNPDDPYANVPCLTCFDTQGFSVFSYKQEYLLPPGKYVWKAFISANVTDIQSISANYTYTHVPPVNEKTMEYAGGLRVKNIIDYDGVDDSNKKVKSYIYRYKADKDDDGVLEEYSYGIRMSQPQYTYFEDAYEHKNLGGSAGTTCHMTYLIRSSDSQIPLNGSANGSVVGYSRVTLLHGENGEFGKTVYRYENQPDQIFNYNKYSFPFEGEVPYRPPSSPGLPYEYNGLLTSQTDYRFAGDTNFVRVKEIKNFYSNTSNSNNVVFAMESRPNVDPVENWRFFFLYPAFQTSRIKLTMSKEKIFDQKGSTNGLETQTQYFYDHTTHLQLVKTIVTTSNSSKRIVKELKYPADYNDTDADAVVKDMKGERFMHSAVIESTTLEENDGTQKILNRYFTKYGYFNGNKHILPKEIVVLENDSPLEPAQAAPYRPAFPYNTSQYKTKLVYNYNHKAKVKEVKNVTDKAIAYIWGYNGEFPIAEVINSNSDSIAFSSFESIGDKGNWNYDDTWRLYDSTQKRWYYRSGVSKSGLSGTYIVSLWARGSNTPSLNGITGTSLRSLNGWAYYEWRVNAGNQNVEVQTPSGWVMHSGTGTGAVNINNNGSDLDDVRLYPAEAEMTTYNYDPHVGVISTLDANNNISYYEYDNLGRLTLIRDHDQNIIKHFSYNYRRD